MSRSIGVQSEAQAIQFLNGLGYSCLANNFHSDKGEIDLIVQDPNGELIFVEVKYRKSIDERAFDSITQRKQRAIIHTARTYLMNHQAPYTAVSFGVLVHDPHGWHWIPNAFDGEEC